MSSIVRVDRGIWTPNREIWTPGRHIYRPRRRLPPFALRAPFLPVQTATVTLNGSPGTAVTGGAASTLSPSPPISNCLGKLVVMVFACTTTGPTVDSISDATYYRAGKMPSDYRLAVYIKNGENPEPTPQINIGTPTGAVMGSWIFVLDIAGGTFPTISADGHGVLGTANNTVAAQTTVLYEGITVVGDGFVIQFGEKPTTGAGWTFTSFDVTAGHTRVGHAVRTTGANNFVAAAQMQDAATVFGSDSTDHNVAINTNSTSGTAVSLTIEFSTSAASGSGNPLGGPLAGKLAGKLGRMAA